jgi:hypothetical protein
LRLDFDQGAGQLQKIAHFVDVKLLEHVKVGEILVRDKRDRNIGKIHLVLANQIQQQVERTAECIELDAKIHDG